MSRKRNSTAEQKFASVLSHVIDKAPLSEL
jgi:hypothetical protein